MNFLKQKRKEVEEDELNEFAKEKGLEFKRISAKTGEGIIDLFTEATKKIHEKILNQEIVINHQQNVICFYCQIFMKI